MNKTIDVVTLGELLIDFTESGVSSAGNPLLEVNPGGAPCNVLAMLTKLGKKTEFIGKVGRDQFGTLLKETLDEIGIGRRNLLTDEKVNTTLAFVHTDSDGDREFSFYRNPGADMMLSSDEIKEDLIANSKIFHFGTLSMTDEIVRNATKRALDIAKESGCLISFDPNLREPLWSSLDLAKEMMEYGFNYCNILKISDNEIQFVTGKEDFDEGIAVLQEKYKIPLILLTMGKDGSRAYYNYEYGNLLKENHNKISSLMESIEKNKDIQIMSNGTIRVEQSGFKVKTIETTGAGDTFMGCSLGYILDHDFYNLTAENLKELLTFANAGAAIVTTKKGAIKSMPSKEEIFDLIGKQ
ncbi:MAG: PfkB family carbohydrate kinase [Lachnospiraceae bacterium]|jgi:fructokinase|nr:PfkB family carbohydrate kinase [Lachnospiraceae bacterium]